MNSQGVTPQSEDYARWYNDVVQKADLAEYSPVPGCMIIKPYGYELWEAIRASLDRRFKETGHRNAYFPLFIPMSFLKKEAEHVAGFAPQLAVVTHGGGKELEEPLAVRPTSETVIGHSFAQWIHSYQDLPLLINQWANAVRWEMRPRLFLRTREFLWQEGHTAHATQEEAIEETMRILDIYTDVATNEAAIPVIKGRKSEQEKFAGAEASYSVEGMMGNKWALQSGTSHHLGQNFAKAFEIKYLGKDNRLEYCWTTSWGVSTRMVGAIIMAHGDDKGLRLPPRLAPTQVVIVPIFKNDAEKDAVLATVRRVRALLVAADVRVHVDEREGMTPGFKFNDWEMRGVPLRMEVGPRDVAQGAVLLSRRDLPGKEGKEEVPLEGVASTVARRLDEVQKSLLAQATEFRNLNLHEAASFAELREIVADGWALLWHCGTAECEGKIQEKTKASSRCFPLDLNDEWYPKGKTCAVCGKPAQGRAYFARAY